MITATSIVLGLVAAGLASLAAYRHGRGVGYVAGVHDAHKIFRAAFGDPGAETTTEGDREA